MIRFCIFSIFFIVTGCIKEKHEIIKSDDEVIVATIDQDTLTLQDLKEFYEINNSEIDFSNAVNRHNAIVELVNREIILKSAEDSIIEKNDSVYMVIKNEEDEKLRKNLIKHKVIYPNIPEQNLKDFYEKLKWDFNLRHLFIFHNENQKIKIRSDETPYRNRSEAKRLVDSLHSISHTQPDKFIQIIEKYSDDMITRPVKGELGFSGYDTYDPDYRDDLFRLKNGEISAVFETSDGFHVFQKINQKLKDKIATYEELKPFIMASFSVYYETRPTMKMMVDMQQYIDSLLKKYNFGFNEAGINEFLIKYSTIKQSADLKTAFTQSDMDNKLAFFDNGFIPLKEIVYVMSSNKRKVKLDQKLIRKGLQDISITRILALEAKKQSINLTVEQKKMIKEMRNSAITGMMINKNVIEKIEITDNDKKSFYNQNLIVYREPDMVNFYELYSIDQNLINQYYREIKQGADFIIVAKKAETIVGNRFGATGFVAVDRKNTITEHAWHMNPGDMSEPFKWSQGGFSIIKLIEKKTGRQLMYDEVESRVNKDLYQHLKNNLMNLWLAELRDRYRIVLFDKNLEDIYNVKLK